ncbi:sterol desaturase family protein [Cyclobacterium amurskyense]|jgi:sterol desaturase/sphingolipid hydroxylase (fatty acid hydroxylase superfamily)|uniref:Fatty acid hydroxylase n=1 Tax=Cyclobacterium amurskyense TaxID=320787 RepID=A0A0H4PC57_9BACT|nr:sterol desaturase family protein [Cyclobacterium amurskyense]AKP51844.1 Fatty acid hydroxylase [Cyclobacterium amurskyense]|tara:strand:- start:2878 stop:3501 length:624 start_codon:yes stop_codon:yes gene_type:complete
MKKIGRLDRPDNSGTAQMFTNPVLERLSRTHISIPIALFLGVGLYAFYIGISTTSISFTLALALFLGGYFTFTLVEYLLHRYLYHMVPDTKFKDKLQYNVHGVHHDYPKDKDRLAMPPFISGLYAVILYFLFSFLMGDFSLYFLPGFLVGYASYLGVHYIVHAFQPPKNFLKVLWVNHAIHHYKDPDVAFGVSTPIWDYVFGTAPKK